jgi:hypothetical protein
MCKSEEKTMPRVSADISDELNARLKQYVIKKSGMLRGGQSEIIGEAIEEYLDRKEKGGRS